MANTAGTMISAIGHLPCNDQSMEEIWYGWEHKRVGKIFNHKTIDRMNSAQENNYRRGRLFATLCRVHLGEIPEWPRDHPLDRLVTAMFFGAEDRPQFIRDMELEADMLRMNTNLKKDEPDGVPDAPHGTTQPA